jgi:dTDP-glucose pyrophosphorylase
MENDKLSLLLIRPEEKIRSAMKQLDTSQHKVLFVTDENSKLIGTLTDGDVRRWILSDGNLEEQVIKVCNTKPYKVNEDYVIEKVRIDVLAQKYTAVPVVDVNNVITDVLLWEEVFGENTIHRKYKKIDIPIVIMAGGQGTRLEPFTKILPKPLIPIGDKSIIEIIMDKFLKYDVNHFYVSVNHKSKIIKSYFEELNPSYQIEYIDEERPLGTIGGLFKLKGKVNSSFLITNCDIIIDADYADIVHFHESNNYDISLVASLINHKIPYGVCEIENGGTLTKFSEKPEFSFLASTGMYLVKASALDLIPENEFFHITHLMDKIKEKGGKVGVYPISESSFLDTGEWHEYKKTIEKFKI